MKIAIMGGTFNPIHIGHLISAEEVHDHFGFDIVIFVPAFIPPHKSGPEIIDPIHRYNMTALAIEGNPHFQISKVELDREGPSYSVDTVKEFKRRYGQRTEIAWIIGSDLLPTLTTWKDYELFLEICELIVTTRPGYEPKNVPKSILDRVIFFQITAVDISSSEIRRRVREGRSIKYLVPKKVEDYIYQHSLYREREM
ncbi:TPA: nicotinate-nucleotide adenylyltransferase [Candidatus Poribacteria bacterium]|nr:nicotinate-nucleotide adenylyltransferase [Candidatus Poribacteria bacterium]